MTTKKKPRSRWQGAIARNKQGRLGIVLDWCYDHAHGSVPFRFSGIGIRGGEWYCSKEPIWIAENIEDYAVRRASIRRQHQNATSFD